MPTKLVAQEQPVLRIFSDEYAFDIPPYQRPYAWTTEQAGDLFDDLLDFMRSRPGPIEEKPPYFLGSIVLIKPENTPEAEVVDGQQRLTTLTLLLSTIREDVDSKHASDLTQLIYERGSQIRGTQDRFRLSLRERDREFFQNFVQREGGLKQLLELVDVDSDSQRNLRDNARLLSARVQKLTPEERTDFAQFIVTRCYLVVVATPDLTSAYRIFSVLNTRGLDLSATDILKAQLVSSVPEAYRSSYTTKWEDIEEDLGRDAFGDLFGHIRMMYRKAKPQGTLLVEFRESVLGKVMPIDFVDKLLTPAALVFEELTDSVYPGGPVGAQKTNDYLKWLNRLEFTDWLPPAIAFATRYRNDPEAMEKFFGDLERLAYSKLLIRAGVNERIERFSQLTKAVETQSNLHLDGSPLQLSALEQLEVYSVLAGPIYESLSARARTLLLLRLDALVSGGGATYDHSTVTVEHVLPQTPEAESKWLKWFPHEMSRAAILHTLGNLALLTRKKNSAASRFEFERKKSEYFTRGGVSPFPLTTQVLQHVDWTPDVVAARQKALLSLLEQHWRLEDRKSPAIERQVESDYKGDATWLGDVFEALRRLGGRASLYSLYGEVEALRRANGRSVPRTLDAIVRRTLEEQSSDSDSFKNGRDLFRMPEGRGAGVWALR